MNDELRRRLGHTLSGIDALSADLVQRDQTDISEVSTTFLRRYKLFQVKYFGPSKPIVFYVGAALPERAFLTTGNPKAFMDMARDDGVVISSPSEAINYATLFLEATRSMTRLFYIVDTVDDLQFLPGLCEDDSSRAETFRGKYTSVIAPPRAVKSGEGYRVSCFAVSECDLVRIDLVVGSAGEIRVSGNKLEEDLPLVHSA